MMDGGLKRRDFLKVLGLSGAGLAVGCAKKPAENVYPFLNQPEDIIPGIPTFYASACRECPAGCGVIVTTREGRAIKLEGNPDHPVSRGGICARGQAALQELYNPDRLKSPVQKVGGQWKDISWDAALGILAEKAKAAGSKAAVWSGNETGSPDRIAQEWLGHLGSTRRVRYEAFAFEGLREATRIAFGVNGVPGYDFSKARMVVSIGSADFLETMPDPVGSMRSFADARAGKADGLRYVAFASRMSLTGTNADEFIFLKPGSELAVALGLARAVSNAGGGEKAAILAATVGYEPADVEKLSGVPAAKLLQVARELVHMAPGLAVSGGIASQGSNATALNVAVHMINAAVGAVGTTLNVDAARLTNLSSFREVQAFVERMKAGEVELLVLQGSNPAYSLPAGVGFKDAMGKVGYKVSFARQLDETSELCDLILPASHWLESWTDAVPVAGVWNLGQPSMRPVFATQGAGEIYFQTGKKMGASWPQADWLGYLQSGWKAVPGASDWTRTTQNGGAFAMAAATRRGLGSLGAVKFETATMAGSAGDHAFSVIPHAYLYDGRGANKPWMQEIPEPTSKVMWSSWAEISPRTAAVLGVEEGDVISLEGLEQKFEVPVLVYPGIADDAVGVSLGQGHTSYGRYAKGRGVNPLALLRPVLDQASGGLAFSQARVKLAKTGAKYNLVCAAKSTDQMGRGIAQVWSAAEALNPPHEEEIEGDHNDPNYVPSYKREYAAHPLSRNPMNVKHRWGMAIDLDRCTGCSACVSACYAENNIMWVGEQETYKHRDMGWIRLEKFHEKAEDGSFEVRNLPMTCQQCDNAPCESVCPVYATYHNPEGISAQIYNRCIGTRYCSNNCPYRVRRFNYQMAEFPEPLNWGLNPDVTVRSKGVMEKCNFCIQRIRSRKDIAKDESRDLVDGEVMPACASSCPAQAITFGNLADPDSRVSRLRKDKRGYRVLEVLNTQPNITYLRRVRREGLKA